MQCDLSSSSREGDAAWHGGNCFITHTRTCIYVVQHENPVPILWLCAGCLAVAELGRRGLLLPKRLEDGKSCTANVVIVFVVCTCTCSGTSGATGFEL